MLKKLSENKNEFTVFTIILIIKFVFTHILVFNQFNIFYTLLVEFGFIFFILALVELVSNKKIKTSLYLGINFSISFILFSIIIYQSNYGNILTYHAITQLGQVGDVKASIFRLIRSVYLFLFLDIVLIVSLMIKKKYQMLKFKDYSRNTILSILVIGMVFSIGNIIIHKDNYIADSTVSAKTKGLFTFEILASIDVANLTGVNDAELVVEKEFIEETKPDKDIPKLQAKINQIKGLSILDNEDLKYHGIAKNKNVIIVQGESFQNFLIDFEVYGQEVTPNLNKLVKQSLYFPNLYQQVGPGNTSDAEFASNTSLYPMAYEATSKKYGDKELPSFPKLLNEEGYQTITLHTNDVEFWNRIEMYPSLGFDQYYDAEYFGDEDTIGIGPSDEVLFDKSMDILKSFNENEQLFYADFITLTSHNPFVIPQDKTSIELPPELDNSMVGDYLKSIHYTDKMLGKFIRQLKAEEIWNDTIFVFFGDHAGLQQNAMTEADLENISQLLGHEYSFIDKFNVPLTISIPGMTEGDIIPTVGGQIDILPTLSNIIDLSLEEFIHFGQDIINYQSNLVGMRYFSPPGTFINNDIAFVPKKNFEAGTAFDIKTGDKIEDYDKYKADYDRIMTLMYLSDEYIKQLPDRK